MKQKKSDRKQLVALMKIFACDTGFVLIEASPGYRDDVIAVGQLAEKRTVAFLAERGIVSRGSNAVLKHMRVLHKSGELNNAIARYHQLVAAGKITDPAPAHTNSGLYEV